jgi:dipeptidyl aminopeptidase/acylaminoacyl peptidase
MRAFLIALTVMTAASGPAMAKPAEGPTRTFQGSDLFALEIAGDPQVRPDGGSIAYVRSTMDVMTDRARRSIWLVEPSTGAQTPLVAGPGSHGSPRWSPDGKRLAYVSTDENNRPQLFVRWMATGETARVATLPQAPGSIAWSPDGRTLAFTMFVPDDGETLGRAPQKPEGAQWAEPLKVIGAVTWKSDAQGYLKPGYTHVFTVSADGGAPRQLTWGAFDDRTGLSWTPDSRAILMSAQRDADWRYEPTDTEVYRLDVASGAMTALTDRYGPDEDPKMSPDGRRIAYLGYDEKHLGHQVAKLYVMDADGGNKRSLTDGLDRSIDAAEWAADGRSLFVQYVDKGVTKIARVGLDGRTTAVAEGLTGGQLDRPYSGGEFSVADNGLVAVTVGTPERPSDVGVVRGGKVQRLTRLNDDLFTAKTAAKVQHLPVISSHDQRPVDAWLATPPDYQPGKRYPLILEIHGGPFQSYGPAFSTDVQLYAAAGYVVLYVNPRGSTSYGEEFANLIHHNYPSQDYDDLMSAVDAAIAKGFADPDKLFVTGGSGGGVLTSWIIGKTDRFKAAATQKPVINWSSQVLTTDGAVGMARNWFGKMPWEDPEQYWRRSPLSLVGNVKTPTLVVVGESDYRTPPSEAEQYYQALQLRKVPTMLVRVPGAGHGSLTSRPSQSAAKASAILAWFERYKDGAPSAAQRAD